uniref:Neuritin 1 n=1 Tax=Rattus norvegicus TaxID=10116 RepID=A0ABK0MBB1_RAT
RPFGRVSVANSEIHKRARGVYFWGPVCAERTPGTWACTRARVQCAGELGGARLRSRACAFVSVCVCREPGCVLTRSRLRLELSCRAGENEAYLVQAVRAAGKCDAVFKGFSDCLLKLGDSMANYPQGLDDKTNIKTVCTYWEDFHSCTVTALTDCQEGAKDMWDKLRKESKNLNIQGSLFELCGSGNGAAGSLLPALSVLLVSLSAALATWLSF